MRPKRLLTLLLLAGFVAFAAPAVAHANTYTVYGCSTPSGATTGTSGWQPAYTNSQLSWMHNHCPANFELAFATGDAQPGNARVTDTFSAPSGTSISSFTLSRAVSVQPANGYDYEIQAHSATNGWSTIETCSSSCSYGNTKSATAASDTLNYTAKTGDVNQIQVAIWCNNSNGCPASSNYVEIYRSAMTLSQPTSPQIVSASGTLLSGGTLVGSKQVSIGATDPVSGVYQVQVLVDGQVVETQTLDNSTNTCQQPWTATLPCPTSASGTVNLDTAELSDGVHNLELVVSDAAGNTATWGPVAITTSNWQCSPTPAAGGATVKAWFDKKVGKHTKRVTTSTIDYDKTPTLLGSLANPDGSMIGLGPLCLAERDAYSGAPLKLIHTLTSGQNGLFGWKLGKGPSRKIYVIYRTAAGAVSKTVNLRVRVPVRVQLNHKHLHNGEVMVWKGKLPGPVHDRMLALMEVWRGSYWQVFQKVSVASSGKWAAGYRFCRTTGVQRYRFRLTVPSQSQYPYVGNSSRPFDVFVGGGSGGTACE